MLCATGLVTNLVVVQGGALYTAREGVLRGHIQHMLLEAAKDFGVEVRHGSNSSLKVTQADLQ